MSRTPATEAYDAELLLTPGSGETTHVHALFKERYAIGTGRCQRIAPVPLLHDPRAPDFDRTRFGESDFCVFKALTDLIVQGDAVVPGGGQARRLEVDVSLGQVRKAVAVHGRRLVAWRGGRPGLTEAEPFARVPITWELAYGGIDGRVGIPGAAAMDDEAKIAARVRFAHEHPGQYPRNPYGRGYLVADGELDGQEAPWIEDPLDPLTPERLITGDPARWWRQPVPCGLDWTRVVMWPRAAWFSPHTEPWFPPPAADDELPEVRRGWLAPGWRAARRDYPDLRFLQGASHGLAIARPQAGQELRIRHMHPEHPDLRVALPETARSVAFAIEGRSRREPARLHHIVVRPEALTMDLVFAATAELPRPFIPGIHAHIPISARLDAGPEVAYRTPPTARAALAAAQAANPPPPKLPGPA